MHLTAIDILAMHNCAIHDFATEHCKHGFTKAHYYCPNVHHLNIGVALKCDHGAYRIADCSYIEQSLHPLGHVYSTRNLHAL